jgi:hypothetical protein
MDPIEVYNASSITRRRATKDEMRGPAEFLIAYAELTGLAGQKRQDV